MFDVESEMQTAKITRQHYRYLDVAGWVQMKAPQRQPQLVVRHTVYIL